WLTGGDSASKEYASTLARMKSARQLPAVDGSVDAFSWTQRSVLASGLDYRPRPVIQGYAAYTPKLAAINAAFLRGERAPDNVLFDLQSTDAHYASQEDGA